MSENFYTKGERHGDVDYIIKNPFLEKGSNEIPKINQLFLEIRDTFPLVFDGFGLFGNIDFDSELFKKGKLPFKIGYHEYFFRDLKVSVIWEGYVKELKHDLLSDELLKHKRYAPHGIMQLEILFKPNEELEKKVDELLFKYSEIFKN